jgi:3-hydroxymyristoyl/3-hydroxydecanoyl-(acyl carrier protein) dehydratase
MESALPIAVDHPAFEGHFPGQPILPGVVIVAEVLAAVARDTGREAASWRIASAKFLNPVTPGMPLTLSHEPDGDGVRFEVRARAGIVASGSLKPR